MWRRLAMYAIFAASLSLTGSVVAQSPEDDQTGYSSQVLFAGGGTLEFLGTEIAHFAKGHKLREKSSLPSVIMEKVSISGGQTDLNIKVAQSVPLVGVETPLAFALDKMPSDGGMLLVQLKAGQLTTFDKDGTPRQRLEGEWWTVSPPSDFKVSTDDDTAIIDTILILPQ